MAYNIKMGENLDRVLELPIQVPAPPEAMAGSLLDDRSGKLLASKMPLILKYSDWID